jgi:hypothetical protein
MASTFGWVGMNEDLKIGPRRNLLRHVISNYSLYSLFLSLGLAWSIYATIALVREKADFLSVGLGVAIAAFIVQDFNINGETLLKRMRSLDKLTLIFGGLLFLAWMMLPYFNLVNDEWTSRSIFPAAVMIIIAREIRSFLERL